MSQAEQVWGDGSGAQGPRVRPRGGTVTQKAVLPAWAARGRTPLQAFYGHPLRGSWDISTQGRPTRGHWLGPGDSVTESDFLAVYLLAHSTATSIPYSSSMQAIPKPHPNDVGDTTLGWIMWSVSWRLYANAWLQNNRWNITSVIISKKNMLFLFCI